MRIILVAPHPFYQERGTPIAVKLLAETLCGLGYKVDLLTYNEGEDVYIDGLSVYRIPELFFLRNIPIGFSWKKVIADIFLWFSLVRLLIKKKYDVIHAVEESIFLAALINIFIKKKLIYDMDSSMSDQLIEKKESLKKIRKLLDSFENLAVKHADIVIPVCKSLADKVKKYNPQKKVFVLEDIAFEPDYSVQVENIRERYKINGLLALYVGNLEHYQGIDLLLQSAERIKSNKFSVVIIGGSQKDILKYEFIIKEKNLEQVVFFIGPRSLKSLPHYLSQADILLSPRITGKNTPMKLYSYLASGKPVLATNIESHSQVIDQTTAKLAEPNPDSFSRAFLDLIENESLRNSIGNAGKFLADNNYSLNSYRIKLKNIYDQLN